MEVAPRDTGPSNSHHLDCCSSALTAWVPVSQGQERLADKGRGNLFQSLTCCAWGLVRESGIAWGHWGSGKQQQLWQLQGEVAVGAAPGCWQEQGTWTSQAICSATCSRLRRFRTKRAGPNEPDHKSNQMSHRLEAGSIEAETLKIQWPCGKHHSLCEQEWAAGGCRGLGAAICCATCSKPTPLGKFQMDPDRPCMSFSQHHPQKLATGPRC